MIDRGGAGDRDDPTTEADRDGPAMDRRTVLASVGSAVGAASLAGCTFLERGEDGETIEVPDDRARELAERFAPALYFDERERWFPTDPRPYATEADGKTVVDGFAALEGYAERFREADGLSDPTVFYHVVEYVDSPLAVAQYWQYSAFDQFTTNFHWHDWEVLHVFVDTDTGDPQLYVASSHSRKVPNNEFLDPDPDREPRILSELGSHSSALSVNDVADRFQRLSVDGGIADITNSAIEGIEDVVDVPIAYGLPRDEGSRLPYLVPELDGEPIYEHDRLPSLEREDLIDEDVTVRSFESLSSPPEALPGRETGTVIRYAGDDAGGETGGDAEYDLVPSSELEHVDEFTGPQLSFEFAVPGFLEDAMAGHITSTGVPWGQPRYDEPAEDITDPGHRAALAERYDPIGEPAPINAVVAGVTEAVAADEAPENEGLTARELPTEAVTLLESEPEAVPTFRGIAVVRDVAEGEHRLTVNAPGVAPHGETLPIDGEEGTTVAGVDGEIPLVARENATKLEVDAEGTDDDLTALAVEDDFAGRLYDAPLSGPDAVYVHRGGAYTTEVRDREDEIGAYRVNPADEDRIRIDEPRTGKGPLAEYLADVSEETGAAVAALDEGDDGEDDDDRGESDDDGEDGGGGGDLDGSQNAVRGLSRALEAVADAATRAAERAAAGDRQQADRSIETVLERLDRVETRLAEASEGLPDDLQRAIDRRIEATRRRAKQALDAETL
ncbi:MAG: hypothetical protein V5A46_05730 [Haloferacaceae archaeon]